MILCKICKIPIPNERVSFFNDLGKGIDTCVKHSQEKGVIGRMNYHHKSTADCVVVSPDDEESFRLVQRAYNRSR